MDILPVRQGWHYKLILRDQKAQKAPVEMSWAKPCIISIPPEPDSKKIVFSDAHFNLFYLDVASKRSAKVDTYTNGSIPSGGSNVFAPSWSRIPNILPT